MIIKLDDFLIKQALSSLSFDLSIDSTHYNNIYEIIDRIRGNIPTNSPDISFPELENYYTTLLTQYNKGFPQVLDATELKWISFTFALMHIGNNYKFMYPYIKQKYASMLGTQSLLYMPLSKAIAKDLITYMTYYEEQGRNNHNLANFPEIHSLAAAL
jgi:hypothetical protein